MRSHRSKPKGFRLPVIDRVMERVTADANGCWIFPGATNGVGYGVINSGGHNGPMVYVHRVTYEHFVGPIADGLHIDHLCRVTLCCNPFHLEAVTPKVNILRGVGASAQAARKTECSKGHPFDDENTYIYPSGTRGCRACARAHQQNLRNQRKALQS